MKEPVLHICLAGQMVSNDWILIRTLKSQHQVTVVDHPRQLSRNSVLQKVDVLILDGSENPGFGLKILRLFKTWFPTLRVVLVDGGLNQNQIAAAFRHGAVDYFSNPYDVNLLTERVHFLGIQGRRKAKAQQANFSHTST